MVTLIIKYLLIAITLISVGIISVARFTNFVPPDIDDDQTD